jgi:hypothetical protein
LKRSARRRLRAAVLALVVLGVAAAGCGGGSGGSAKGAARLGLETAPAGQRAAAPPPLGLQTETGEDLAAKLTRRVALRDRPDGVVLEQADARTEFGSPRILPVVRREPGWLGVVTSSLPNGRLGWIAEADATLVAEPVRIVIDLRRRLLLVRRPGRTVLRVPVGIGTPTPTGLFAVTDGLTTSPGSPYGCCVLALSGHQPNIPQGWTGGDRLAVHGTTSSASIGLAASHGCLRASDADLRRLLKLATLGARVEVRG